MDYQELKTELDTGHPDTGAYNADDVIATAELNTVNRAADRPSLSGDEIFAATDNTEFLGLSDHKQQLWVSFTGKDTINAFETTNIDFLDYIFGAGSTTKATLSTLRVTTISRAAELGFGVVKVGDVQHARTL